jgi:hypothetical protein
MITHISSKPLVRGVDTMEELAPLIVGSPGTHFNVFPKQQRGMLIQV